MRQGITSKNSVSILFPRREIFVRQGIPLAHFLCNRVQGVELFSTHPCHFPSQVPPGIYYRSGSFKGMLPFQTASK